MARRRRPKGLHIISLRRNPTESVLDKMTPAELAAHQAKMKQLGARKAARDRREERERVKRLDKMTASELREESERLTAKVKANLESLKRRAKPAPATDPMVEAFERRVAKKNKELRAKGYSIVDFAEGGAEVDAWMAQRDRELKEHNRHASKYRARTARQNMVRRGSVPAQRVRQVKGKRKSAGGCLIGRGVQSAGRFAKLGHKKGYHIEVIHDRGTTFEFLWFSGRGLTKARGQRKVFSSRTQALEAAKKIMAQQPASFRAARIISE